jgi:hypothetical protein
MISEYTVHEPELRNWSEWDQTVINNETVGVCSLTSTRVTSSHQQQRCW